MTYAIVGFDTKVGENSGFNIDLVGVFYHLERANRAQGLLVKAYEGRDYQVVDLKDGLQAVAEAKKVIRDKRKAERA